MRGIVKAIFFGCGSITNVIKMFAGIHVVLGLLECFLATIKQSEPLKYLL